MAQLVNNQPVGDLGSVPGLGRSPGEGKGYPLQYSGLENSVEGIVHEVAKSWTQLSDFRFQGIDAFSRVGSCRNNSGLQWRHHLWL